MFQKYMIINVWAKLIHTQPGIMHFFKRAIVLSSTSSTAHF